MITRVTTTRMKKILGVTRTKNNSQFMIWSADASFSRPGMNLGFGGNGGGSGKSGKFKYRGKKGKK